MQIYYKIWADAILSFRKYRPKNKNWKITLLIVMSWGHAVNLWIIMIWLQYFEIFIYPKLNIEVFPGTILNNFFSFAIPFNAPFLILNYFLVFYKKRYEKIIVKYKNNQIRYALNYSISIAILAFISVVLYGILTSQY